MNFVVFTWNFMPLNDPEAFCTSRFVNALAKEGHSVHVVAVDHGGDVPESTVKQILTEKIQVTKIKPKEHKSWFSKQRVVRGRTYGWSLLEMRYYAESLIKVLKETPNAILITRYAPPSSLLVGLIAKKYSKLWVSHLSDPFPIGFGGGRFINRFLFAMQMRASRRMLRNADLITITCPTLIPRMRFLYGDEEFNKYSNKVVEVTHIGDPAITYEEGIQLPELPERFILHAGFLSENRYADVIANALVSSQAELPNVGLVQLGGIDPNALKKLNEANIDCKVIKNANPEQVSYAYDKAAACLVADTRTPIGDSPFLPSKFVYLIFTNRPIIALTKYNSYMYKLAKDYAQAGIFCANPEQPGELEAAIKEAIAQGSVSNEAREQIRELFSRKNIIPTFVNAVNNIIKKG